MGFVSVRTIIDNLPSKAGDKVVHFLLSRGHEPGRSMDLPEGVWSHIPAKRIVEEGFFDAHVCGLGDRTKQDVLKCLLKLGVLRVD